MNDHASPPCGADDPDRAFAANILGALSLAVADRVEVGTSRAVGLGANGPAALVMLLWYPDRPITHLASRLRISHPGAVQLSERLERAGLIERHPGVDGRTKLLWLTPDGEKAAKAVMAGRRRVLDDALSAVPDAAVPALVEAVSTMLQALADDLLTSEFMCRMCDELSCPERSCPVERAEPAPRHRRGTGYTTGADLR